MADYCGEYSRTFDSGDSRAWVLGDFLEDLEAIEAELGPGMAVRLGICEGHGTGVKVGRDFEGRLWFVHVPLGPRKPRGMPKPVEIPPSPHEPTALPAMGELEALVLGFVEHALPLLPGLPREDELWTHVGSFRHFAFKLGRLLCKAEARLGSPVVPAEAPPVLAASPPPTAAELAALLTGVERGVLRTYRTLDPTSLAEHARMLRFVVAQLEALEAAARKRREMFANQEWTKQVAEKQAENAAERVADEERRQEWLAEQREKRLASLGRKPKG